MITLIIIVIGLAIAVVALSIVLKKKREEIENLNSECQIAKDNCNEFSKMADYYKHYALRIKANRELTQFIRTDDTPQAIYDRTDRLLANGFTYKGTVDGEHLIVFSKKIEVGPSNEDKAAE